MSNESKTRIKTYLNNVPDLVDGNIETKICILLRSVSFVFEDVISSYAIMNRSR